MRSLHFTATLVLSLTTLGASAQAKAFTSASGKNTTAAMWEGVQKNPASANVAMIPGYLLLGCGVQDMLK
jgi:hypothetical protein